MRVIKSKTKSPRKYIIWAKEIIGSFMLYRVQWYQSNTDVTATPIHTAPNTHIKTVPESSATCEYLFIL